MPPATTSDIPPKTRLAPSPTGALHLGNCLSFVVNWVLARQQGWTILLRIDDLDSPRTKPGADRQAMDLLQWLGMDWDEGPTSQAHDLSPYRQALQYLQQAGHIFPSSHSRRDLLELHQELKEDGNSVSTEASAPQETGQEAIFPAELRPSKHDAVWRDASLLKPGAYAWRLKVPLRPVSFHDERLGSQSIDVASSVGDFVVATKEGLPSYQLATVVDDHRQGVTHVVRGDDLLDSTARQRLLYEALGYRPVPETCHLPLVRGEDGRRLAKRHGDTRVSRYREAGVTPERVLGLLAWWAGMSNGLDQPEPMGLQAWLDRFDINALPAHSVTMTASLDRWLLDGAVG